MNPLATLASPSFGGSFLAGLPNPVGLNQALSSLTRGITSGTSGLPIRESLELEVSSLMPADTPLRNRLPRIAGAGLAHAWRQVVNIGGGWGSGTGQPGGGTAAQAFFAETGAPAELASAYAAKSAPFRLLGQRGSVTGLAMAAGDSFFNQFNREKTHAVMNLMLMEEHALINGSSSSTAAPWGDGTNALAFDGLTNLIATANGIPTAQVQTSVGALTLAHLDEQLTRVWSHGGRGLYMVMNAAEMQGLIKLAEGTGSLIRIQAQGANNKVNLGMLVGGYVHPISGEVVDILVSRFLAAGTILFGSDRGPDGSPAAEVVVLPQVQLPEAAPHQKIQGYVVQETAPAHNAPQVYGFLVSVFEVLAMKNALVFAKSTGITAPESGE